MRLIEENKFWRRPCGCPTQFRFERFRNVFQMFRAWKNGRTYANWDGFLDTDELEE